MTVAGVFITLVGVVISIVGFTTEEDNFTAAGCFLVGLGGGMIINS